MPMLKSLATKRINYSIWVFCTILFALPGMVRGQSATPTASQSQADKAWSRLANNGAWWNALSPDSKADFVDGYVSAMAAVHQTLKYLIEHDTKELTSGPTFDSQMAKIMQLSLLAERCDFQVGKTNLLAGMDAFYKEPLNKLIPIEFAFLYERDTLNGKVAPRDLQKQLDEWRAAMNK
jgi:hypothetical protein